MKFMQRVKSFIFRLDYLKINKTKGFLKFFYYCLLKSINGRRWILAYFAVQKINNLNEYFSKIDIFWYGGNEGHTQQVDGETVFLSQQAVNKSRVLEIGFNGGHSSETLLLANKEASLDSVDIGFHHYVKFGEYYMKKKFNKRFKLYTGKSSVVLPELINSGKCYDLIFIDGSHAYEDVYLDLKHANQLSHDETLIIMDDVYQPKKGTKELYFDHHNSGPTQAWQEFIAEGLVVEKGYEQFDTINTNQRSIAYGYFTTVNGN